MLLSGSITAAIIRWQLSWMIMEVVSLCRWWKKIDELDLDKGRQKWRSQVSMAGKRDKLGCSVLG